MSGMPLTDYFAAPSDEVAATAVDHDLLDLPPEDAAAGRVQVALSGTLVVQGNLSPVIELGRLEEILTGRPYDKVAADPRWAAKIAPDEPEDVVVVAVTDTLRDALAALAPASRAEVAARWATIEEFQGADPTGLEDFLAALSELSVRGAGQHLYCRFSL